MIIKPDFRYDCQLLAVTDGDTFVANLAKDVGFNCVMSWKWRIRVAGINCPEKTGPTKEAGLTARAFTFDWLYAEPFAVETLRQDDFGRWVSNVFRADGSQLADALVASDNAVVMKKR